MFNETTYFGDSPVTLKSCAGNDPACLAGNFNPKGLPIQGGGPCEPLETAVDVGADTAVCMTQVDLAAFLAQSNITLGQFGKTPAVNNTYLWLGMAAVVFVAFAFGGRR